MKRKILIIFLIILMLMPIFSFNIPGVKADPGYEFSDGFESGDFSEWDIVKSEGYMEISTLHPHTGTYSLRVGKGISQQHQYVHNWEDINETENPSYIYQVAAWVYYDTYTWGDPYGEAWAANVAVLCEDILPLQWWYCSGAAGVYSDYPAMTKWLCLLYYDGYPTYNEIKIEPLTYDTWIHLRVVCKVANASQGWVKVYVNGTLRASKMGISNKGYGDSSGDNIALRVGNNPNPYNIGAHDLYIDDVEMSAGSYVAMSLQADLENVDNGGADWVFTNWKYYDFTLTLEGGYVENASISFTVPTSWEAVNCTFFANSTYFDYQSNMSYETREGEPCLLSEPSWSYNDTSTTTTVIFPIWFQDTVLDVWEPSDAIDVYGSYNSTAWDILTNNCFRIYSKGGFTLNTAAQNASHAWILEGGTPFSFHVEDGDATNQWMYNEVWYRDVQHLKLLPEIHFLTGKDGFDIKYGVDYSLGDGKWEDGWYFDINPDTVHYNGLFTQAVWINMTCYFLARGGFTAMEDLYMYNHGSITGVGDPGFWEIWVDLWVSDKNASSVGAGRLNAYEYAMEDSADLWLRWLANNWAPIDDVFKEFQGEAPLLDDDDSTILSSERVVMWRFWSQVKVFSAGAGQVIEIKNFEHFDATRSSVLPLTGISSPIFDETIVPVVGSKGLLGAIYTMFASLGSFLSENVLFGGLNLWGAFVGFLDTIAAMFGAPKFFSNLFNTIAQLLGYFVNSMSYIGTVLVAIFQLITTLMATFLGIMGDLIGSLIDTFQYFTDMMGGAYGVGVNIWSDLGISTWVLVVIVFYPIYLIILWDEQGEAAVIQQLSWLFGLLSWIFGFLVSLVQFLIRMITSIIESIPIAE